jgi:class 3 adenylate cyclase/tetratricopeptide (TPR) repeat protein
LGSISTALSSSGEAGDTEGESPALSEHSAVSYICSVLAARLASGEPLRGAESVRVRGALLQTDIEGWTSFVEHVSAAGREGLDELGSAFNAYFVQLAETVYGHGGDILTVNGDAFLCGWLVSDAEDIFAATARATRAALEFQGAADRHPAPSGKRLRTRIGVAAGEFEITMVGGVNGRWELLPAGEPLDQVALAERRAPTGGVAVASSAWGHIAPHAEGSRLDGDELFSLRALHNAPPSTASGRGRRENSRGEPGREPGVVSPEALAPFIPAPVRGWRAASGTEWLAELRRVTVVMARLLDPPSMMGDHIASTHVTVRTFQQTIARFEGASKPVMDSKGMTLSAVFGLPPRAHQDDAERAVRAASALSEQLEDLGLRCSIGVATGRAFCGLFGSDLRREYTLHGDVTNLAARLAYAGQAGILCDELTAASVSERFGWQPLAPIALKGRVDAVPVRRLHAMRAPAAPRHSPLVGRERERALLADYLARLTENGDRGAIVVEGDAGIGKSALLAEGARMAEQAGVRVLTAAADAVERATGYYAWRQVFASVLGLSSDALDPAAQEQRVRDQIGGVPEIERMAPLLSSVLPIAIPDNEVTAGMRGDVREDNTTMLLTRILSRCTAVDPVLLLVEDAHWLDSNSWALLQEVVRLVPRLLALITTRPIATAGPESEYADLLSLASSRLVHLTSLSADHTAALIRQRLGVADVPPALSRFVEDRVAGHPYFCEALIKTMQEGGIVRVTAGAAVVGELEGLDVPATVEGAVLSLVDRLSPQQQLSLKVAAVVGRTFSARAVSEAYPVVSGREAVPEDLRTLATLDLLTPQDSEGEPSYTFRHQITREVAYELLTTSQRRPLHRAVAEWFERTYSTDELEPHCVLLAHHWSQADHPARAMTYLERAGRQALRGGAFREAVLFYSQLIDQSGPDVATRRALWEQGMATANYFLGDFGLSRALLEQALARLDRAVPKGRLSLTRGLTAAAAQQLAHLARPARYRDRRRSEKDVLDEAVDCYKVLGQISYLDGESPGELIYLELAGLNLGEEAGSSPQLARALANGAGVVSLFNLRRLADRYTSRAVRMAAQEGHTEALAYVWNVTALVEAQRGNWRRGIAASDRALELFGEIGEYNFEAELWQTRSALHICAGDFREAETCWRRTRELAARNANPQLESWSLLDEAQTQLGRGETDAAADALERALAIETAASDGGTLIEKHYSTAATRQRQGRRGEALRAADAVLAMATARFPSGFHWADFTAGAVEVYLELLQSAGQPDERAMLERRAARGCQVLGRIAWTFHGVRPRRWLLVGMLEHERGHRDGALRAWRKAEAVATTMGMDYDVARARLEMVRHGLAGGQLAQYADALQAFERLGAGHQSRIAQGIA